MSGASSRRRRLAISVPPVPPPRITTRWVMVSLNDRMGPPGRGESPVRERRRVWLRRSAMQSYPLPVTEQLQSSSQHGVVGRLRRVTANRVRLGGTVHVDVDAVGPDEPG